MKTFNRVIAFFVTASAPLIVSAAISSVELKGVVKSFDEKTVTVQQSTSTAKIPRDYIAKKQIKAGDFVEVKLTPEQFLKLTSESESVKK